MRRGGIVGFQEGGIADELTYGDQDEQDSFGIGDALKYPFEHPIQSASALALAKIFGPKVARDAMRWQSIPSAWGKTSGAIGKVTEGLGSLLRSGAGTGKYNPARWVSGALTRPWSSTPSKSTAWTNISDANRALGRRGLGRGILGGLAGIGTTLGFWPSGDEDEDEVVSPVADQDERRRTPSGEGAGRGGMYQDLFEKIKEYEELASVPSASELTRYKLAEDRANELGDYQAGIARLRPTEEQYGQSLRGASFSKLSQFLGRTGDPSKRQDFGQIGEAIRAERDRQLREKLGFEDKLAGIDTDIYGVESGSLAERVKRERAGDPFRAVLLGAMQSAAESKAAHRRAMAVANVGVERENQKQIARLYQMLMEQTLPESDQQMIIAEIQRLGGGGGLSGLMEQAQGAR